MALTGHEPEGYGCLKSLLIVFIVVPGSLFVLGIVAFGLIGAAGS